MYITPQYQILPQSLDRQAGPSCSMARTIDNSSSPYISTAPQIKTASISSKLSSIMKVGSTIVEGATGLFTMITNWGKMGPVNGTLTGTATGAAIGSLIPGVGTGIGALVGGAVGLFSNLFGSGKPRDQKERDQFRNVLLQAGVIDENCTIGLADGTRYDIGIDGKPKAEFGGLRPHEIDFNRLNAGQVVGMLNPLLAVVTGGDKKLQTSFVGYFTNAALSNAGGDLEKARMNVLAIYAQFRAEPSTILNGLAQLARAGRITGDEYAVYVNGLREFFMYFAGIGNSSAL